MSALAEIKREGVLTKRQFEALERKLKQRAKELKLIRAFNDRQARKEFRKYLKNKRSWKGLETSHEQFRKLMRNRHKLHERIARIVPEIVEPEWDSP